MATSSIELVRHPQFPTGALTREFDPSRIGVEGTIGWTIGWTGPPTVWPDP
jgi:hypothetical protein